MDILIKSFNRPYYLERCIRSIELYVKGDFQIKILDDGTPSVYLERIKEKYPYVQIMRSPNYDAKVSALQRHIDGVEIYKKFRIPSDFWYSVVKESTEIFMLIEDDIWFTNSVHLNETKQVMQTNDMVMLRLAWQGNGSLVAGDKQQLTPSIEMILPHIPIVDKFIFLNKFKIRSILNRVGFFKSIMKYQLKFYVLYAVASALFTKEYWLYLWKDALDVVLEESQLKKASDWFDNHTSTYGKLVHESTQTSYISSTTNGFVEIEFDMIKFNFILNQAWLSGELDVMEGFPKDFSIPYFKKYLSTADNSEAFEKQWIEWVTRFKHEYKEVGCQVD